jgi:hypothetical protein
VKHRFDSPNKYSEADIEDILGFLVGNVYVVVGGQGLQQSVGIPMGTNFAPLLANVFLYSCEAEFVQKMLRNKKKTSRVLEPYIQTYRRCPIIQQ